MFLGKPNEAPEGWMLKVKVKEKGSKESRLMIFQIAFRSHLFVSEQIIQEEITRERSVSHALLLVVTKS